MTEGDPTQNTNQGQDVKTEDNAPINVRVCLNCSRGISRRMVDIMPHLYRHTLACGVYAHSPHSHTHSLSFPCTHAGRHLNGRRSLFQNQAKYKVEQAAGRLCKQSGQGCGEYSVCFPFPFVVDFERKMLIGVRSQTGSCMMGIG